MKRKQMIKGKGLLALALAILLAVTNMTFGMEVQAEETSVDGFSTLEIE